MTAAELRASGFQLLAHVDGQGFYRHIFRCVQHSRFTVVKEGPRGRAKGAHTRRFLVDGQPVDSVEAAASALSVPPQKAVWG